MIILDALLIAVYGGGVLAFATADYNRTKSPAAIVGGIIWPIALGIMLAEMAEAHVNKPDPPSRV